MSKGDAASLRARSREVFEEGIEYALRLMRDEVAGSAGDRLRALDMAGKYGLGEAKVVIPDEIVAAVGDVLGADSRIPAEMISEIVARLAERLREAA
jgi:hypothetical protein